MINVVSGGVITVAPVRERGLKFQPPLIAINKAAVAPVRERGLKFTPLARPVALTTGRSREGAWIEILNWLIVIEVADESLP